MHLTGGCFCGALRYEFDGEPVFKGQCHCRECQFITGGHPNAVFGLPVAQFRYTKGTPKSFVRDGSPTTREFCETCGTHILGRSGRLPLVNVKVGTLDDPALFGAAQIAVYVKEKQSFHALPENAALFQEFPPTN
jgi:hypothetical protein